MMCNPVCVSNMHRPAQSVSVVLPYDGCDWALDILVAQYLILIVGLQTATNMTSQPSPRAAVDAKSSLPSKVVSSESATFPAPFNGVFGGACPFAAMVLLMSSRGSRFATLRVDRVMVEVSDDTLCADGSFRDRCGLALLGVGPLFVPVEDAVEPNERMNDAFTASISSPEQGVGGDGSL